MSRIVLNSLIALLLLRLVKRLCLAAAETACECGRLTARYCIVHEVVAVSDSVVVRTFESFNFSYHVLVVFML